MTTPMVVVMAVPMIMAVFVIVAVAMIVGMAVHRELGWRELVPVFKKSVISSAVIMFIIANAGLFSYLITRAGADRVVNPQSIGGSRMAAFVLQPHVTEFLDAQVASKGFSDVSEYIRSLVNEAQEREADGRLTARIEGGDGLYPWIVATEGKVILGYAYAAQYNPRAGYRYACEDSIYLRHDALGQGIGTALLAALIAACEAWGFRQMIAGIAGSEPASVALHARAGIEEQRAVLRDATRRPRLLRHRYVDGGAQRTGCDRRVQPDGLQGRPERPRRPPTRTGGPVRARRPVAGFRLLDGAVSGGSLPETMIGVPTKVGTPISLC